MCGLDTPVTLPPVVLSSLQWLNRASFFSENLNEPIITWGEKKTTSGAFSWLTSHVCSQAEILPPPWPMVTMCVGEERTTLNLPLCWAVMLLSLLGMIGTEVGLEVSPAKSGGHATLQRQWMTLSQVSFPGLFLGFKYKILIHLCRVVFKTLQRFGDDLGILVVQHCFCFYQQHP